MASRVGSWRVSIELLLVAVAVVASTAAVVASAASTPPATSTTSTSKSGIWNAAVQRRSQSSSSSSSSSYDSYNPYQYDLFEPFFTPDGRLLQTEYARAAATDHSSPIICAHISPDVALLACVSSSKSAKRELTSSSMRQPRRPYAPIQERLIVLPKLTSTISASSSETLHDNPTIVVALAGIRADSLYLLHSLLDEMSHQHGIYAEHSSFCTQHARTVATNMATKCHDSTIGGGLRPLGATVWTTSNANFWPAATKKRSTSDKRDKSLDDHDDNDSVFILHQTDPSGALYDVMVDSHHKVAILGGGGNSAGQMLQRRLDKLEWKSDERVTVDTEHSTSSERDRRRMGQLLSIVVEEHEKQQPTLDDTDRSTAQAQHSRTQNGKTNAAMTTLPPHVALEVVLLSPTRGVIKLSRHQVQDLLSAAAGAT